MMAYCRKTIPVSIDTTLVLDKETENRRNKIKL